MTHAKKDVPKLGLLHKKLLKPPQLKTYNMVCRSNYLFLKDQAGLRRTEQRLNMDYMIRFIQVHETFRLAEIKALAVLEGINLEIVSYNPNVGYFLLGWNYTYENSVTLLLRQAAFQRSCY